MILKICVEIKMPENLLDQLRENNISLDMLEDGLAESIADTVGAMLPVDTELNDCYPVGWDV